MFVTVLLIIVVVLPKPVDAIPPPSVFRVWFPEIVEFVTVVVPPLFTPAA